MLSRARYLHPYFALLALINAFSSRVIEPDCAYGTLISSYSTKENLGSDCSYAAQSPSLNTWWRTHRLNKTFHVNKNSVYKRFGRAADITERCLCSVSSSTAPSPGHMCSTWWRTHRLYKAFHVNKNSVYKRFELRISYASSLGVIACDHAQHLMPHPSTFRSVPC